MSRLKLRDIKEFVFGTPDRILSFASVVIGAVSLVLTVILWTFPEAVPELIILRDIIVVVLLLLISGVTFYKYLKREIFLRDVTEGLASSNSRLYTQFKNFHVMVHKFRSSLFSAYLKKIPSDLAVTKDEKKLFECICHSLTSDVKKIFQDYFAAKKYAGVGEVCVTIKLTLSSKNILDVYGEVFNAEQKMLLEANDQWVITAFRDPETYESKMDQREVGCRIYNINKNTAFIHIFKEKKQIFACDDLGALGETYLNENRNWKEQYNATIVAPVRFYYYKEGGDLFRYFGLVAVDCMNPGKNNLFRNDEATNIVGQAADLLANYFLVISLGKYQPNAGKPIT